MAATSGGGEDLAQQLLDEAGMVQGSEQHFCCPGNTLSSNSS